MAAPRQKVSTVKMLEFFLRFLYNSEFNRLHGFQIPINKCFSQSSQDLFGCMATRLMQTATDEKHSVASDNMTSNTKIKKKAFGLNIDPLLSFTTIFTTKHILQDLPRLLAIMCSIAQCVPHSQGLKDTKYTHTAVCH